MSFGKQIFVVVFMYLVSFIYIRGFLSGLKRYQLTDKVIKKRNMGQTFKDWFLYSRYREEIPKILLNLYFVVVVIHPIVLIFFIIFNFLSPSGGIGDILIKGILVFDLLWIIILRLLFWQKKPGEKYERWIKKRSSKKK